jgi:uncharacterized protein YfaS (alpha-2-macroglobulin family)
MDREYERFHHFIRHRTRAGYTYPVAFTAENQVLQKDGSYIDRYKIEANHRDTGSFTFRLWQDSEGDFQLETPDDKQVAWYLDANGEFIDWCRLQINRRFIA